MGAYQARYDGEGDRERRGYNGPSEGRYPNGKQNFPWKNCHAGRVTLIELYQFALHYGTDDELEAKKLSTLEIKGQQLYDWVIERYPAIKKIYRQRMGKELKPGILMDRLNLMYWTGEKTGRRSEEHPKDHPKLRPYLRAIERHQKKNGFLANALHDFMETDVS